MTEIDNVCEGCLVYELNKIGCRSYKDNCPCRSCLIKMMCSILCDDFRKRIRNRSHDE
jgi:hypothetical protein